MRTGRTAEVEAEATTSTTQIERIREWFARDRTPALGKEQATELYFTFHPRTAFLKTLPQGAKVVDIGAGDGSLSVFRKWPAPRREDLALYAYSMEKGRLFDDFDGFEVGDWNAAPPEFAGLTFDAVVCAHFIEHIADPSSLARWAARKLGKGARIYLEWPSPESLVLPSRSELEQAGVPLIISRFDDDHTHHTLPDGDEVVGGFEANGFSIATRGTIRLPWLEDEMLAHSRDDEDGFPRQAAFWSYTGWSQYIIAERF